MPLTQLNFRGVGQGRLPSGSILQTQFTKYSLSFFDWESYC